MVTLTITIEQFFSIRPEAQVLAMDKDGSIHWFEDTWVFPQGGVWCCGEEDAKRPLEGLKIVEAIDWKIPHWSEIEKLSKLIESFKTTRTG